jgi:Protein of unknown function (DUF2505)
MKTLTKKRSVNIASDKLFTILTSSDFEKTRSKKVNEDLECEYNELKNDNDLISYELKTTEYAKGITGVDKSKTENSVYTYKWNKAKKAADWTMKSAQGDKVRVSGTITLSGSGDKTELVNVINVEIKIAFIGGKIEKMVIKEIEKSWPRYDGLVDEFIKK